LTNFITVIAGKLGFYYDVMCDGHIAGNGFYLV